jgi:hypothetical protein
MIQFSLLTIVMIGEKLFVKDPEYVPAVEFVVLHYIMHLLMVVLFVLSYYVNIHIVHAAAIIW